MLITNTTEIITPEMAREYLEKNTSNRRVRLPHIKMLAREIGEGRWTMNGQGLVFADTGRLLDGQHRLEAVVMANKPIEITITRGVPESAYAPLDQGIKRSAADDLRNLGILNATRVASAARLILLWRNGATPKTATISKSEITDFIIANPFVGDAVSAVHPARKAIPTSGLAAVYWMALNAGDANLRHRMEVFLRGLSTGADLTIGSPILTLRNSGQALRKGASMSVEGWFGLTIQAWNAHAAGEQRKVFKNTNWPDRVAGYMFKRMMGGPAQALDVKQKGHKRVVSDTVAA
jgi:hypothetical protein